MFAKSLVLLQLRHQVVLSSGSLKRKLKFSSLHGQASRQSFKQPLSVFSPAGAPTLWTLHGQCCGTAAMAGRDKRDVSPLGATDKLAKELEGLNLSKSASSRTKASSSPTSLSVTSLQEVADYIQAGNAKSIVVMAGAGISTASGIPDFRSPGTGLYDNLQQYRIPYPEAIFDLTYFRSDPAPFFALAKALYPTGRTYRPNVAHYFLRLLHEKGLLLRIYTQNIDGLERLAGIPVSKLVEAHGTLTSASCIKCGQPADVDKARVAISADKIPRCQTSNCRGVVKPDIVFFGENLPEKFFMYERDLARADLLLILGTSLEVYPFAGIADEVQGAVPRVLINRELVGPFRHKHKRPNDVATVGDIVEQVRLFADMLQWTDSLDKLMAESETAATSPVKEEKGKKSVDSAKGQSLDKQAVGQAEQGTAGPAERQTRGQAEAQAEELGSELRDKHTEKQTEKQEKERTEPKMKEDTKTKEKPNNETQPKL